MAVVKSGVRPRQATFEAPILLAHCAKRRRLTSRTSPAAPTSERWTLLFLAVDRGPLPYAWSSVLLAPRANVAAAPTARCSDAGDGGDLDCLQGVLTRGRLAPCRPTRLRSVAKPAASAARWEPQKDSPGHRARPGPRSRARGATLEVAAVLLRQQASAGPEWWLSSSKGAVGVSSHPVAPAVLQPRSGSLLGDFHCRPHQTPVCCGTRCSRGATRSRSSSVRHAVALKAPWPASHATMR
jgi:hypothetical protein